MSFLLRTSWSYERAVPAIIYSCKTNTGTGKVPRAFNGNYVPERVENPEKILDDFTSTVSEKFNFCPLVKTDIIKIEDRNIIYIDITEAPRYQKPIYVKDGGPLKGGYKRMGAADIRLTDEDVHRFYLERRGSLDSQIFEETTIEDIEQFSLNAFRELRKNDRFILKLAQPFWTTQDTSHVTPQIVEQIENMDRTATIIKFCEVPRTLKEIMDFLKLKDRKYFFESILKPMLESYILKKDGAR